MGNVNEMVFVPLPFEIGTPSNFFLEIFPILSISYYSPVFLEVLHNNPELNFLIIK